MRFTMSTPADPDFTLNHLLVEVIQVGFGSDLDRQPGQIQKMKIVEREFSNTMKKGKKEKKRKEKKIKSFTKIPSHQLIYAKKTTF